MRPLVPIWRLFALASLVLVMAGAAASASAAAAAAASAPKPPKAPAAKPKTLTGYAKDALWEVNAQNLTCDELNRLRYLTSTSGTRDPSLSSVMGDIAREPAHSRDSPADIFSSILRSWAGTADIPTQATPVVTGDFAYNPRPMRPGELTMLGYLDIAARERNCSNW